MVSPAGPAPAMAIFLPLDFTAGGIEIFPAFRSKSAAKRSRRPIATGSPFFPKMQTFSHWSSCGQTRPHTAGRPFVSFNFHAASIKCPSAISLINSGILTSTGQPPPQPGFLHWIQRVASMIAVSSEYPIGTSSKLRTLFCGSCSGIFCRGTFSFFSLVSLVSIAPTLMFFISFPLRITIHPQAVG